MQHNKVNFGLTVLLIFILNIKYCPSMFCTNVISCDVTLNFCSFSEHSCPWISGFDSESKYIVHPGIEHIHVLNCCENLVLNKLSYSRAISYACPLSRVYILVPSSMAAFMREGPLHRVSLGNYYLVTDGRLIPWNFTCAGIIFDTCTSNLWVYCGRLHNYVEVFGKSVQLAISYFLWNITRQVVTCHCLFQNWYWLFKNI